MALSVEGRIAVDLGGMFGLVGGGFGDAERQDEMKEVVESVFDDDWVEGAQLGAGGGKFEVGDDKKL